MHELIDDQLRIFMRSECASTNKPESVRERCVRVFFWFFLSYALTCLKCMHELQLCVNVLMHT